MLLERSQVLIGLAFAVLLGAGTVFAVALSGNLLTSGMELTAGFEDAAGLQGGSDVFVAGVRVGQVVSVERPDGAQRVRATFTLQEGGIPADSGASIILENSLGKRGIQIEPGTSDEFLQAGDHIPMERTSTPIKLPELGDRSAELLGEVNVRALQDIMSSLAEITAEKREDVTRLLDGVQQVSEIVAQRREELRQVIRRAESFVDAAEDRDEEIVRIVDAIGTTLTTLTERREDVTRLLEETARSSRLTADLLQERDQQIDGILDELHRDLQIVDDHQVDLAHGLAGIGVGVEGFASIGYMGGDDVRADTPSWGNVFTTNLGQIGLILLDCGGTMDELLTSLIGPDPQCQDSAAAGDGQGAAAAGTPGGGASAGGDAATPTPGSTTEPAAGDSQPLPLGGLADFFSLPSDEPSPEPTP